MSVGNTANPSLPSGICGDGLTWSIDAEDTLYINGTGAMSDYTYGTTTGRYSSTTYCTVPWYAYTVKKIIVSEGVTSIGDYAFYKSDATSISLPSTLKEIGEYAFGYGVFSSITLPSSMTGIGSYAFQSCTSLTSVAIDAASIGSYAFYSCTGLTSVTISASLQSIGAHAFYYCSNIEKVYYLNSCTCTWSTISFADAYSNPMASSGKAYLYLNGSLMREANLHSTGSSSGHVYYKDVSDYAFYNCQNAFMPVSNGGYNGKIGNYAYYNCINMTGTSLASGLASIGDYAFYGCANATYWYDGIWSTASIGAHAFDGCTGLTSCEIPSSIKSIGSDAFYGCSNLTAVYIDSLGSWLNVSMGNSYANPFYANSKTHSLYINNQLATDIIIPDSVSSIGSYKFYNCSSLTSITIPDSVTSIGSSAFFGCSGLTSITLPFAGGSSASNTYLGYIFGAGSYSSNSSTVPSSLKTVTVTKAIGSNAFYGLTGLTSITIQDGVTSIGSSAFYGCSGLTNITIPDSVTSIGSYAFYGCSGLASITIPDSVTSIGSSAFYHCSKLAEI